MKVIIAGSRTIHEYALVEQAVQESGFAITAVGCGCAEGVDKRGGHCYDEILGIWFPANACAGPHVSQQRHCWACRHHVPALHHPANWAKHGKAAGAIRNREMAEHSDALVAIWDGKSRGTSIMIDTMRRLGKPVYVKEVA